jgi:hypothetical protein
MLSAAGLDGERYEAALLRNRRSLAAKAGDAARQNAMRHCTLHSVPRKSGELHPHCLTENMADSVGISVLFDMPEFSLAADDGVEIVVAEFGLSRKFAGLAGHGFLRPDRPGAVIAPFRSRDEE